MFRLVNISKAAAVTAALFLCFSFITGCDSKNKEPSGSGYQPTDNIRAYLDPPLYPSQKSTGNSVSAPVEQPDVRIMNAIEQTRKKYGEEEDLNERTGEEKDSPADNVPESKDLNYIVIDGLANKEVEAKINKLIYDTATGLYDDKYPPYRGIRTKNFDDKLISTSVETFISANFGNILSVGVQRYIYARDEINYENSISISETVPLNFNLINGELIPLSDLFADNCDYKSIVANEISDYISKENLGAGGKRSGFDFDYYLGHISVVSPFKGISDNQKYLITENETIDIIVDYNMPEFDTEFSSPQIAIDFSNPGVKENLAVFQRFENNDSSLYTSERGKVLRQKRGETLEESYFYVAADTFDIDHNNFEVTFFRSMPLDITNESLYSKFRAKYDSALEDYLAEAKTLVKKYPNEYIGLYKSYAVEKLGKYITEQDTEYCSVTVIEGHNGSSDFKELRNFASYTVYLEETGEKLTLSQLFADGADYVKLITDSVNKSRESWGGEIVSIEQMSLILKDAKFIVRPYGIDIISEMSPGVHDYFYADYTDLGLDNITVFD